MKVNFNKDNALLCALNRIFDNAIVKHSIWYYTVVKRR